MIQKPRRNVWKTKIFWELTTINAIVIAIVIWIAGVSVKDFSCVLANELNMIGDQRQAFFNETMDFYLLRASILAFFVAAIIHYIWIKRIVVPLQTLSEATKRMREEKDTDLIPVVTQNEIGQLTEQFNHLIIKMKRSEALRKQMTADLAHEVRTPLSNLTGYLEALKNDVIEPDKQVLTSLHAEAERLKKMIEQLYQLSEREWAEYKRHDTNESCAIKPLINEMIDLYTIQLKKQSVQLNKLIEPASIMASKDRMKQVIGNLLDNAIRYAVEDTTILISGKKKEGIYIICVAGKGQEIPPDTSEQLFERFYRVDSSRSRASGGNGLGLAIVKELMTQQGGRVYVKTDGIYHQFYLEIPLIK
ncbi:HAMP domain-containing sensor histidine kinase [Bacillus sp. CGMCC 1.16541]|uniref:sensor histidine kinase n=1 Tax=Bacillus sp. CGMCC 1.16541 TaxID=2185143 RepID=UPI000D72EF46|nr:HAMP domain-containing sensor histidine kinase [Bacillus sp. CGMCC 1.16541]